MSFAAVLFDCDGVLVDSEPISLNILCNMLADLGWQLNYQECKQWFKGQSIKEDLALIQRQVGKKPDQEWIDTFTVRRNQALRQQLVAVPGIYACLKTLRKIWPTQLACVSAAEKSKILLQLDKVGLTAFFNGLVFSGVDTPLNKPFPDVYLAAAETIGVNIKNCAVIEDSFIGVTSGVAAGATVFGYCPHGEDPQPLLQAGAHHIFHDMQQLPSLLQ